MSLKVNYCITCGSRPVMVSTGERVEVYRCMGCGRTLTVEERLGEEVGIEVVKRAPSEDEIQLMQALYRKGQVWDEQVDRETRKKLRRLEEIGLVECRTLVDKRSFWQVSIKGIRFLEGEDV